jgi:hypothetical protein
MWYSAGLRAAWSGVRVPAGARNFSLQHHVQTGFGAHPASSPIQWVPGALSLGVKWPGREADHSPPSSAEVKECVEIYLHSPNRPSGRGTQLKHRDNFTFILFHTFSYIYHAVTKTLQIKVKDMNKACFYFMCQIPIRKTLLDKVSSLIWKVTAKMKSARNIFVHTLCAKWA